MHISYGLRHKKGITYFQNLPIVNAVVAQRPLLFAERRDRIAIESNPEIIVHVCRRVSALDSEQSPSALPKGEELSPAHASDNVDLPDGTQVP